MAKKTDMSKEYDFKTPDEKVDGPKIAASIINSMPSERRERLLSAIQKAAPETFREVKANIFSFDDLPNVIGNGLQVLIRECDHEDLVLVLRHSSNAIRATLFANMSERKRSSVIEDLEQLGNVSAQKVTAAKDRLLARIEELRTAGIIVTRDNSDILI